MKILPESSEKVNARIISINFLTDITRKKVMPQITKQPMIKAVHMESICDMIAETSSGLTGSEIGKILRDCGIKDVDQGNTKRFRLYNAFVDYQNRNQCSNAILIFLAQAMNPSRYLGNEELYVHRLNELNKRLSFIGIEISKRGGLIKVSAAKTLSEAQTRASHYKIKLELRKVHPEVFKYCKEELLQENYFHSVFEGVKSVAQRLRDLSGVHADGNKLVEIVLSPNQPLLKINAFLTDTDRSEHIGLLNTIKGLFGIIRNPTAHVPKIKFKIEEEEALDIMTIVSFVHKKLDRAF